MNLASLRYLVALNEHRHFGRAAQACHITQPALSNALRALEKELDFPLVKRGRSYAGLTAEGERVLASARRMLREHELLLQEMHGGAEAPSGPLRLGAVPTAVPIAARFAAMLQARWPGIVPVVRSMSSQDIEAGLDDLSLDLGLGFIERSGRRGTRFAALPQYGEHYFLVRRAEKADVPLRLGQPVAWKTAAALPLCLLTPDMHNRSIVEEAFAQAGVKVRPAMETNSILTLALSVVAGDVCSVLPGSLVAAARGQPGLRAQPLIRPAVVTPVGFITLAKGAPSRVLQAALGFAADKLWLREVAAHSGALASFRG